MKTTTSVSPSSVAPHMSIGVPCRDAFPWRSSIVVLVSPYRVPCDVMIAIVFAPTCRSVDVVWNVAVAAGAAKANKDSTSQRPDPRTQVTQVRGCGTQPGARQRTHKRMRSELSRNRKRDLVSSVRAQSAKCVTGQNTSEQRGSVEHIALC